MDMLAMVPGLNSWMPTMNLPFGGSGYFGQAACQRCSTPFTDPMAAAAAPVDYGTNALLAQLLTMLTQLMLSEGFNGGYQGGGLANSSSGAGSNSGTSTGFDTPGQLADPSQFKGGTETGRRLAAAALKESTDGDSQGGWCARDVKTALREIGISLPLGDAWQMAEPLARDSRFREIQVAESQLESLPPGAIVVWDKTASSPYGHISVALGDGREASDLLRKQLHLRGSKFRVFIPL